MKKSLWGTLGVVVAIMLVPKIVAIIQAHPLEWKTANYPTDGFAVDFSDDVKIMPLLLPQDERIQKQVERATNYLQSNKDSAYSVAAILLKPPPSFSLEAGFSNAFNRLKCKTISNLDPPVYPQARTMARRGDDCLDTDVTAIVYTLTKENRVYEVVAIYHKREGDGGVQHFLNSFKLLGN